MDTLRIKQLAGIKVTEHQQAKAMLNEVVELTADLQLDDLIKRMDACSRALKLVNTLKDQKDRQKWLKAVFVNLNKIRGAIQKQLTSLEVPQDDRSDFIDRVRTSSDRLG